MLMSFIEDASQMIQLGKPHLALMSCRNALETMIKSLCNRIGVDTGSREMNLEEEIKLLYEKGAIDARLNELFHRTRKLCNKGAHADSSVSMDDAMEAYAYIKEIIGRWTSAGGDGRLDAIKAAYNVPMKDPDYYSASRRYYGKWADCFNRGSLLVIPEYVDLLSRADDGDVSAMLDLAVGFLSRDIIWNANMLINTPPVVRRGKAFNHECAYDFRYYYWILRAVQRAACLLSEGQDYPKKYMATAVWEAALFSYNFHAGSEFSMRTAGVDVYFDQDSRQYLYEEIYSDQIEEMNAMFGCDPEESANMIMWHNVYREVAELVNDIFGYGADCSIVAPIHAEGRANTGLKLRFIRYATLAYCTARGDDSIRLTDRDAADINEDYRMFRYIAPDVMTDRTDVVSGAAFTWEMLRPYTVGTFCDRQFRYGVNHGKAEEIRRRREKSNSGILQVLFGM